MSFQEKVKESIVSRAAEGLGISVSVILIWAASILGPILLPAIESALAKDALVSLLLSSLALNIVFLVLFWILHKKPEFKLKYGIYWDKERNPHCPNCKIPIGRYADYTHGKGYFCRACNKVFSLADPSGNHVNPEQAISEL